MTNLLTTSWLRHSCRNAYCDPVKVTDHTYQGVTTLSVNNLIGVIITDAGQFKPAISALRISLGNSNGQGILFVAKDVPGVLASKEYLQDIGVQKQILRFPASAGLDTLRDAAEHILISESVCNAQTKEAARNWTDACGFNGK